MPELLDQPVVELATPLALQERLDFIAALQKLDAIAPATIRRVSQRHSRAIARVPRVFRDAYFCAAVSAVTAEVEADHFQFLYVRAKKDRDRSTPGVSASDSVVSTAMFRALLANRDTPVGRLDKSLRRRALHPGRLT